MPPGTAPVPQLYSDADGDFQVEAVDNEAELNCPGKINLVCGQSVVHSIDEVGSCVGGAAARVAACRVARAAGRRSS